MLLAKDIMTNPWWLEDGCGNSSKVHKQKKAEWTQLNKLLEQEADMHNKGCDKWSLGSTLVCAH